MRIRMISSLALSACLGTAFYLTANWRTTVQPSINEASFARIKEGMTEAEVAAILGPPGVYTSMDTYIFTPPMPSMGLRMKWSVEFCVRYEQKFPMKGQRVWYGDAAFITIYLDSSGRVRKDGGKFIERAYSVSDSQSLSKNGAHRHSL